MNNENRFYVLENGEICRIPDDMPASYLLASHACLNKMPDTVLPGSIAYLPNKVREWQKGVNGKWIEKEPEVFVAPDDFKVAPMNGTDTIWGHTVSDLQENMFVGNGEIHGSLSYVSSGTLATDWGAGYFMALEFSGNAFNDADHIWVGLDPSVSSGLVDVINDPDRNGSFKVTDKKGQFLKVVIDYGKYMAEYDYYLGDLVLSEEIESEVPT